MHLEIIDKPRIELLNKLKTLESMKDFAMGEGTALSLQLGLRVSEEFNFFTSFHFDPNNLLEELKQIFPNQISVITLSERISTLDLYICDIKVSFFEYRYSLLNEPLLFEEFKPIKLLNIEDIACMKAVAIYQRGTKKDFFDLYFSIIKFDISPEKMLKILDEKYHDNELKLNCAIAITFFDDAELDFLPLSFVDYSWLEIKKFFISYQQKLIKLLKILQK